jgi:hypothetical protein
LSSTLPEDEDDHQHAALRINSAQCRGHPLFEYAVIGTPCLKKPGEVTMDSPSNRNTRYCGLALVDKGATISDQRINQYKH